MDVGKLSRQLAGQVVSHLVQERPDSIALHLESGSIFVVQAERGGVTATLHAFERGGSHKGSGPRPTRRQREYLEFIAKYTFRYGVAPAESDIAQHFLVSAPSVNQMIKTLERRGFIARRRDAYGQALPRSIRINAELVDFPPFAR